MTLILETVFEILQFYFIQFIAIYLLMLLTLLIFCYQSTNQVSTKYSDNVNDANSVINLMFFRPNILKFDNYTIYPELRYSSNYALLIVNIPIIEEFILNKRHTIIKNNKEKYKFIFELIEAIKKINTKHLIDKDLLKLTVQEFANKSDVIWYKHSRYINTTKHSKAW